MEDLLEIHQKCEKNMEKLDEMTKSFLAELHKKLWGAEAQLPLTEVAPPRSVDATPHQTKKRVKRLSSLQEHDTEAAAQPALSTAVVAPPVAVEAPPARVEKPRNSARASNSQLLALAAEMPDEPMNVSPPSTAAPKPTPPPAPKATPPVAADLLMPPPPAPSAAEVSFARPQRAAKLKSEKNLKEPKLNGKLRRPSKTDEVRVKLENEQRASQAHVSLATAPAAPPPAPSPTPTDDSVHVLPERSLSTVEVPSEDEERDKNSSSGSIRQLRVKVKREKVSMAQDVFVQLPAAKEAVAKDAAALPPVPLPLPLTEELKNEAEKDETVSSLSANTTSTSAGPQATKKGRKKKIAHRPIKVERLSEIERPAASPIAGRTRQGSHGRQQKPPDVEAMKAPAEPRAASIYEDAVESLPDTAGDVPAPSNAEQPNATVVLGSAPAGDATFSAGDATFQVGGATPNKDDKKATDENRSLSSTRQSMETAHDISQPQPDAQDWPKPKAPAPSRIATSAKAYRMPTRTNELFNPLVQSPVKKKVEAFEIAAAAASDSSKAERPKRTKENLLPTSSSNTTPIIGKMYTAPLLGRFLTPTQSSNITPNAALAQAKRAPNSASKAQQFPKSTAGPKTLSRENSAEEMRRGLHLLAEERKRQREQKHLLAAQQREAKERERAERIAKLAKEREEKRQRKQLEAELKKRELEEIQRKLRQQEEAEAKQTKKKATEQERELLKQMKVSGKNKMPPPPAPGSSKSGAVAKYTFEMLHEDDSTDDEGKISYKRPPPPAWSRSDVRGEAIRKQQSWPTEIIDSFFSVQPMTPDLKVIFPEIDPRYLKRNSSVLWSTPPRYSELPKY